MTFLEEFLTYVRSTFKWWAFGAAAILIGVLTLAAYSKGSSGTSFLYHLF